MAASYTGGFSSYLDFCEDSLYELSTYHKASVSTGQRNTETRGRTYLEQDTNPCLSEPGPRLRQRSPCDRHEETIANINS